MTPSIGFKEGRVGIGGGGITSLVDCDMWMGTSSIDAPSKDKEAKIGYAGHSDSNEALDVGCLYGDSSESGSDARPSQANKNSDAAQGGSLHNHVHYYVHIPNGDDSTYQTCDRNIKIDP